MKFDENGERLISITREKGYFVAQMDYTYDRFFERNPRVGQNIDNFYELIDLVLTGDVTFNKTSKELEDFEEMARLVYNNAYFCDLKADDFKNEKNDIKEVIESLYCEGYFLKAIENHSNDKSDVSFKNLLKECIMAIIIDYLEENWDLIFLNKVLRVVKTSDENRLEEIIDTIEYMTNNIGNYTELRENTVNYISTLI